MMGFRTFVLGLMVSLGAFATIPKDCGEDKECLIDLPGSKCADGTESFLTLTKRKDAKQLFVYLSGGGACWSKSSCDGGYARPLTREENPTDWTTGPGIHDSRESKNPFGRGYDVATIPYCTGDGHIGNRSINYNGRQVNHNGYENVKLAFKKLKELYPNPEKVVLLGCSAGGIGSMYHLRTLQETFPDSQKYVIDDAGVPFKPPHVNKEKYLSIMRNWGTDTVGVVDSDGKPILDFGTLIRDNIKKYSDIKFGLLASYRDKIMTFFGIAIGTMKPFTVVHDTIIDVGDNDIGLDTRNAKVFYTDSNLHCHTEQNMAELKSEGVALGDWLGAMTGDKSPWETVRPDLKNGVQMISDIPSEANEVRGWIND